jgi:alpha-tubulin suppressor-like RCC1 family protein
MPRFRRAGFAALLLALHACAGDSDPTKLLSPDPGKPSFAISDGANPPGQTGFYFLPPLVPQPAYSGQFDPNQSPEVRIVCTGATGPQCPTFMTASIKVDSRGERYVASWKGGKVDRNVELGPGRYRIEVSIGQNLIGYADLWFVSKNPELTTVGTGYIGMVAGRLPDIPFRIETGLFPGNSAPVAADDEFETDEDEPLPGNVLDNDSDPDAGDVLSAVVVTNPANGALDLNSDGSFVYTPAAGFSGMDSFTYRASDGTLESNTATVTITVNPAGLRFTTVSAGRGRFACALTPEGKAYCWGPNGGGQLGDGTTTNRLSPTEVLQPSGVSFTQITTGFAHTCALTAAGQAYCWGSNTVGELGSLPALSPDPVTAPRAVEQAGVSYVTIVASASRTCALDAAGTAYCWGNNSDGLLGVGVAPAPPDLSTLYITRPRAVAQPAGVSFSGLARAETSLGTMCGLTPAGQAYCWGLNNVGQIGDGTTENRSTPTPVTQPTGVAFAAVSTEGSQSCGVTASGAAYCWGRNTDGSFGNGSFGGDGAALPPTAAATSSGPWQTVRVGNQYACGLNTSGRVFCWGSGGRLGNGSFTLSTVPVEVLLPAGRVFVAVAAGDIAACALSDTAELYCWGQNMDGSVGDGTMIDRLTPVRIE